MTSGPRRFRSGYRSGATEEWILGTSDSPDAIVGYYDPDADQWVEGIADIESGEWIPVDAVRAGGGRDCPPGFPVKGNLPSRVFHTPGQQDFDRTTPEVCFASEAAARDAGFRHSRLGAGAAAAAAPVAAAASRPDAGTPTPPPPPRQTAPPPPAEPDRNWLWWILGALAIAALLWWFFFRPQQPPVVVEPTPAATVAAPAATTPEEEEEEEDEAPAGIVATPAMASPVSARATPMGAGDDETPEATPRLATAVADAVETAEAELDETETPTP